MMCDKGILQPFFEDLNYVSPNNQLPQYKLSNSQILYKTSSMCMLFAIKTYFLDILTLEGGTDWLSRNIRRELPIYAV